MQKARSLFPTTTRASSRELQRRFSFLHRRLLPPGDIYSSSQCFSKDPSSSRRLLPTCRSHNRFLPTHKTHNRRLPPTASVSSAPPRSPTATVSLLHLRWRVGMKTDTTQNIMCACDFNMLFTYVMSGWEGTANDSRVILETITNSENSFPMPQQGKYYVVDSGYTNLPGFLAPYRGETYHLQDFDLHGPPQKLEQLFNYHHSSLRNVIERSFGVLKARFPILSTMLPFPFKTQKYIPIACCTVHNFIRRRNMTDRLFRQYSDENMRFPRPREEPPPIEYDISRSQIRLMAVVRDNIAKNLWDTYGSPSNQN